MLQADISACLMHKQLHLPPSNCVPVCVSVCVLWKYRMQDFGISFLVEDSVAFFFLSVIFLLGQYPITSQILPIIWQLPASKTHQASQHLFLNCSVTLSERSKYPPSFTYVSSQTSTTGYCRCDWHRERICMADFALLVFCSRIWRTSRLCLHHCTRYRLFFRLQVFHMEFKSLSRTT